MNFIKCEKLEKSMAELQFSIDAEAFKGAVADVFKKEGKKYSVPGFRKGKAPRSLIEKMYGADVFTYDAINELFPAAYEAAVKEAGIEPVGRPEVSVDAASETEGVTLTVKVAVMPEVKVGNYNGLTVEKTVHTVSDEAVEAELKRVQERNARELTREGAAENGDIVDIDFEGFVDGVAFEGGKAEHYSLTLGSGSFIPGFEDQIVGHAAGEEFDVNVTFPEQYQAAELAGKPAVFKIKLHEVKYKELPALDDELAKDISDYETIAEYRDHVREDLEKEFTEQQESDYATRLMKAAVDNMTVELPEPMILAKLDAQLRNYISTMGISPELTREQVLASMGLDEKTFQEIMRPQAVFELQTDLLLDAIVKAENIELDEGELDETYNKMAEEYKMEVDKIKQYVDEKIIVLDMKRRKAAQLIRDTAVDKEPEAKEEAAETKEALLDKRNIERSVP